MRIAHLSDLHFCGRYKKQNIVKTNKLLSRLAGLNIDHLVITGDISDNADERDFITLRKILQSFKLLRWDKTSVVIGNHDIFGGAQTAQDVIEFPKRCGLVDFNDKVEKFAFHFAELFENTVRLNENEIFPYAKEIGGIVFFGINSVDKYSRLKNPFAANGRVSKLQKENLKLLFNLYEFSAKKKVVLMHHHLYRKSEEKNEKRNSLWNNIENYTMKLRGKKKLLGTFAGNGVELILHGHYHEMKDYARKGIRIINSASSIDEESIDTASASIIDLGENGVDAEIKNFNFKSRIPNLNILDLNKRRLYSEYEENRTAVC